MMSVTSSALGEAAFFALAKDLQSQIDDAFNSVSQSGVGAGGGFIVEDTRIPLSSIPSALALLDLPPNDRQILAVFRDAAESDEDEMSINRSQWRAVCAVLLEGSYSPSPSDNDEQEEPEIEEERKTRPRRSNAAYKHISNDNDSESGDDSTPYVDSDDDSDDDNNNNNNSDDDDEYTGHSPNPMSHSASASKANNPRPSKKSATKPFAAPPDSQVSLHAFALFFPSIPRDSNELLKQKIMLKDLQYAMKTVGEKYKVDDLTEMLDLFSTSPDKSISFPDFEKIMGATGLA